MSIEFQRRSDERIGRISAGSPKGSGTGGEGGSLISPEKIKGADIPAGTTKAENIPSSEIIKADPNSSANSRKKSSGAAQSSAELSLPADVKIKMIKVSAGTFELGGYPIWSVKTVSIPLPFEMSETEITQAQFKSIAGDFSHFFKESANCPIESVSWLEAGDFCRKLTAYLIRTRQISPNSQVRLPSEFEWEYVAKATDSGNFDQRAWTLANSDKKVHDVGGKKRNAWGFADLHGNVSEWCADSFEHGGATSLNGALSTPLKVVKGGAFSMRFTLASERGFFREDTKNPSIGFRIVISKKD